MRRHVAFRSIRQFTGVAALSALAFLGNAIEGNTMTPQSGSCVESSRNKISEMFRSAFSIETAPEVISCEESSTAWASFSSLSAELTPQSVNGVQGMKPLGDPAWFPMDLLSDRYRGAFEDADWSKVTYAESFDPATKARIFLINSPDKRSFVVITSE